MRLVIAGASASSALNGVPVAALKIIETFGVVTSTFRTVEHNRAVGGVPDSYHLLGRAIDVVRRPGIAHAQIAAALRRAGFVLIESLDEGNHSHFAFATLASVKTAVAERQAPARDATLAADEHGSLLSDLVANRQTSGPTGPILRAHVRSKK